MQFSAKEKKSDSWSTLGMEVAPNGFHIQSRATLAKVIILFPAVFVAVGSCSFALHDGFQTYLLEDIFAPSKL